MINKYVYTGVIKDIENVPTLIIPNIPTIKIAGADTVTMLLEAEERLRKYIEKRLQQKKALPDRNTMVTDYIGKDNETAYDLIVYVQQEDEKNEEAS